MKKFMLCTIFALGLIMVSGCKKKDREISVDDVQNNTILVKNDGAVQAATVEAFDKNYYNMEELTNFITKQINNYNQANGQDSIVMGPLQLMDGNAVLVLNYISLDHYTAFNKVEAAFTTAASAKNGEITLPDVYVSASDGAYASPEAALENDKYKVLVLHEETDVIVDGTVKYFTNATLVSESKLQTGSEDETVIIYKP